jgi:hypothetical protein
MLGLSRPHGLFECSAGVWLVWVFLLVGIINILLLLANHLSLGELP